MHPAVPHQLLRPTPDVTYSPVKSLLGLSNKNEKSTPVRTASTAKEVESATRVTALTDIPRGTCTEDIDVVDLTDENEAVPDNIAVCVSEEGKLRAVGCDRPWIQHARFADDCHSCNAMLQTSGASNTVTVHVVRSITSGDELQLWFSEQMLAALAVPFLTPLNIQGEKRYVCHRCGRNFEIPNPLKIHLALDCDRLKRSQLWKRLSPDLSSKQEDSGARERGRSSSVPGHNSSLSHAATFTPPALGFKFELFSKDDGNNYSVLSRPQDLSARSNRVCTSNTATACSVTKNEDLQVVPNEASHSVGQTTRPISEPLLHRSSAFRPYWGTSSSSVGSIRTNTENVRTSSVKALPNLRPQFFSQPRFLFHPPTHISVANLQMQKPSSVTELLSANSLSVSRSYKQNVLPPTNFQQRPSEHTTELHHAAEMETLVSNLGRSKQGHLCIYCGKIYSRKYGLKIHIRTHTGYKPLKCKFCLRPFGDPSNLNKHVRLHAEGDTPYKCDLCGKILVRRRDLERHVKSRHSPRLDTERDQETNNTPDT